MRRSILLFLLAMVSIFCSEGGPEATPPAASGSLECDPDNGGITLPDGFCALVVAEVDGTGRHLAVRSNGDVFIHLREREDAPAGGIVALRDADGDGRAEVVERFGDRYGTGLELYREYLYFSDEDRDTPAILRYRMAEDQLVPEGEPEVVVTGFPGQRQHAAKPFTFDESGHLYVTVGGPANACQEKIRTRGSRGQRPCPLLERHAGIWRFDAEATGQTQQEDGHRYATGIRHAVALSWNPVADAVYVVQHGRDQLDAFWPEHFDEEDNAELPAEEMFRLKDGGNYGWPYCYYDPIQEKKVLAPEYGGDGNEVGECDQYEPPVAAFPAHWGPNDLLFYTGESFPERYRNGAFIAFHGSWNRAPLEQGGYNVVFQPMTAEGEPNGDWEVFAEGFAGSTPPPPDPDDARFRPTGLALGPDGSLYVSDSMNGRIWRIVYKGD